jgi:hypothetical protein
MGEFEEPGTDVKGGMEFLEVEGAVGWCMDGLGTV